MPSEDTRSTRRRVVRILGGCAVAVLLACQAPFTPVQAQSIFGAIDPLSTTKRVSPAPNIRWEPTMPLPPVQAPGMARTLPPELKGPLSLAQLTELALTLNPSTAQAWAQARAEAAQLGIDRSLFFPQISGLVSDRIGRTISATSGLPNTTLIDQSGNPASLAQGGQPYGVFTIYGPSLTLTYILFDFGKRAADVEATEYRLLAANLTQNRTLQEVATQVEQAYYQVLGFEQLIVATQESLKNFEAALDAAQRRRESGLATVADVYRAETQVAQTRLVLTRNQGDLSKARGLLASTVGLPANFPLQLRGVAELPPVAEITQSMDALFAQAKANRPDLAAAEARARAARATARAQAKAGLPSVDFAANYGRNIYTNALAGQDVYNFTLNLRIPIFTGFGDTYRIRQREDQAKLAEATRDQLYTQTELDVWQAYYDLQTANDGIKSTQVLVKSAEQTSEATFARYQAGYGSLLDLLTARQDEASARAQRIQSYLDWYSALARLNFSIGISDILSGVDKKK